MPVSSFPKKEANEPRAQVESDPVFSSLHPWYCTRSTPYFETTDTCQIRCRAKSSIPDQIQASERERSTPLRSLDFNMDHGSKHHPSKCGILNNSGQVPPLAECHSKWASRIFLLPPESHTAGTGSDPRRWSDRGSCCNGENRRRST